MRNTKLSRFVFRVLFSGGLLVVACAHDISGIDAQVAIAPDEEGDKSDRVNRRLGQSLVVVIDLQAGGEYAEPSADDTRYGWREDEENGGYALKKSFTVRSAPWRKSTFDYTLALDEDGTFRIDYSWGDSDYVFRGAMKLPKKAGKFIALDVPYEISASGGDNVSGVWGGSATVTITVSP